MTEAGLRRSRMRRAWVRLSLGILGLVGGMVAGVVLALWRNRRLRTLPQVGWEALSSLDAVDWFISMVTGCVTVVVMGWFWAALMRRTQYLSDEELKDMERGTKGGRSLERGT